MNLFRVLLLLSFFFVYSCRSGNESQNKLPDEDENENISVLRKVTEDSNNSQNILYIKPKSLVFFSLSDKEFKHFIHRTGQQSEWDFEIIYKQFKKLTKNTKEALKNEKIHSYYIVNPKIAFITKKGDTLFFDRKENDLFVGQIFFNGEDSLDVEEGLMKKDSLENYIKTFFNLKEDFTIKSPVIHIDYQKVIKKDTTETVEKDTLSESPGVNK